MMKMQNRYFLQGAQIIVHTIYYEELTLILTSL